MLPQISVRTAEGTDNLDHLPLHQALARLKELFQDHHAGNGQPCSSDTQARTDDLDRDSDGGTQDGSSHAPFPDIQTPLSHEGDTN